MASRTNIASGSIAIGVNYVIYSTDPAAYVTYNSVNYYNGQSFIGTSTATYTESGVCDVYENTVIRGGGIEFDIDEITYNETTIIKGGGLEIEIETQYPESTIIKGGGLEIEIETQYPESTIIKGANFEVDKTVNYFIEGEGEKTAYNVNGIGIHLKSGYTLEINPNSLSFFIALHGYKAGDFLTFNQLVRLVIDYTNNITANFNNGITVVTKNSGALLNNTAYLCTTRGTTNFSNFTSDTVTVNKPFVTNNAGTPTWSGGTVIQQILLIDNLYIIAN